MPKTKEQITQIINEDAEIQSSENKTANQTAVTLGKKILIVLEQILDVLKSK